MFEDTPFPSAHLEPSDLICSTPASSVFPILSAYRFPDFYPSLQMELEAPEVQFKAKSPGHQLPHLVAVFLSWLTVTSEIDNVQRPSRIH